MFCCAFHSYSPASDDDATARAGPYADATAIKYITRHRDKGGSIDIKKAIWFLKKILADEYKETE